MVSPKRGETALPAEPARTYGVGWSEVAAQLFYALDLPVRNPEIALALYEEMADEDETVGTGLEYLAYGVVGKMGEYRHEDARIRDVVDRSVEALHGTIQEVRQEMLVRSLVSGFCVSEFTLGMEGPRWVLSSVTPLDPRTCEFLTQPGPDNAARVHEIRQTAGGRRIDIPAAKCMILRHGGPGKMYGRSRLRRCRRWYLLKRAIPRFWAVALERFGMPMLIGKSDDTEAMDGVLMNAWAKAHFAIGPEDAIETLGQGSGSGGTTGEPYSLAIEACDKRIYRALFLPSLLGGGEQGGSYSLGQTHYALFDRACSWLARSLAEAEIEQIWRPLIEWNFGPQPDYGEIPLVDEASAEEREVMSRIFLNGVNGGYLYPEDGDADWMRERLGLPEMEEGASPTSWRRTPSLRVEPAGTQGAGTRPSGRPRPGSGA